MFHPGLDTTPIWPSWQQKLAQVIKNTYISSFNDGLQGPAPPFARDSLLPGLFAGACVGMGGSADAELLVIYLFDARDWLVFDYVLDHVGVAQSLVLGRGLLVGFH